MDFLELGNSLFHITFLIIIGLIVKFLECEKVSNISACSTSNKTACPSKVDCRQETYIHATENFSISDITLGSGERFYIVRESADFYYGISASGKIGYVYKTCLNDTGPYCDDVPCKG